MIFLKFQKKNKSCINKEKKKFSKIKKNKSTKDIISVYMKLHFSLPSSIDIAGGLSSFESDQIWRNKKLNIFLAVLKKAVPEQRLKLISIF